MLTQSKQKKILASIAKTRSDWKYASIEQVEEILGGWESKIYSADLVFRDSSKLGIVLRCYEDDQAVANADRDALIMRSANDFSIDVPEVFSVVNLEEFSQVFLVMQRIEGQQARQFGEQNLIRQQAAIQAAIHQISADSLQYSPLLEHFKQSESFRGFSHEIQIMRANISKFALEDFAPLLGWLDQRQSSIQLEDLAFIHNDFHPENVIVDRDDHLFVLDWGFATLGDRRSDLAWTLHQYTHMFSPQAREEYLASYEEAINRPTHDLQFFEVLKLGQRLVTIATWMDPDFPHPIPKIDAAAIRGDYKIHVLRVYERVKHLTGAAIPIFENL